MVEMLGYLGFDSIPLDNKPGPRPPRTGNRQASVKQKMLRNAYCCATLSK